MILRSKNIVIFGNGFEAFQRAAAIRTYLDSIGIYDTKITVFDESQSEFKWKMGNEVDQYIWDLMKNEWISVL